MPKAFRKQFRCNGLTAHVHRRRSGKYHWNYEIRCQIDHRKINVSSNSLEEAKRKFLRRLEEAESGQAKRSESGIPTTMDKFSMYYFENFRKRKVSANTYRITLNEYKNHILPHFGDMPLKKITPKKCQELIDKVHGQGIARTAEDIFTLLNLTFQAAIKHGVLASNPMDMVFREKHEREHGNMVPPFPARRKQSCLPMSGVPSTKSCLPWRCTRECGRWNIRRQPLKECLSRRVMPSARTARRCHQEVCGAHAGRTCGHLHRPFGRLPHCRRGENFLLIYAQLYAQHCKKKGYFLPP